MNVAPAASHEHRLREQHGEPRREHCGVNVHERCRGLDAGEARVVALREPDQDQHDEDDRHADVIAVTAPAAQRADRIQSRCHGYPSSEWTMPAHCWPRQQTRKYDTATRRTYAKRLRGLRRPM